MLTRFRGAPYGAPRGRRRGTKLATATASGSTYSTAASLERNTYLQLRFAGDTAYTPCVSTRIILVRVRARLSTPTAPRLVRRNVTAAFSGTLTPAHAGKTPVELWRKVGRRYVRYKTYKATNAVSGSVTRWRLRVRLPYRGTWRIRALHSDTDHATSASAYKGFTVR